jgi:hypothetical protein
MAWSVWGCHPLRPPLVGEEGAAVERGTWLLIGALQSGTSRCRVASRRRAEAPAATPVIQPEEYEDGLWRCTSVRWRH